MKKKLFASVLLLLTLPVVCHAQGTELALDFRPFSGVLSIAWPTGSSFSAGLALGGGIDELDRTLHPDTDSQTFTTLLQLAHVGAFVRKSVSSHIDADLGLRAGIGSVRECGSSDCWPGLYTGMYANLFWGSERVKVGPRLLWAVVRESGHSDSVLYLEILTGRISVRW
jgi:hypothetical protein